MTLASKATLSVSRTGGALVLKLSSAGVKAWERMEVAVRLSESDREWLREVLK